MVIQEKDYCPLLDVKLPEYFLETQPQRETRVELLGLLLPSQPQKPRIVLCTKVMLSGCLWSKHIVEENAKLKAIHQITLMRHQSVAPPPTPRTAKIKLLPTNIDPTSLQMTPSLNDAQGFGQTHQMYRREE